jgi:hypothetical protein
LQYSGLTEARSYHLVRPIGKNKKINFIPCLLQPLPDRQSQFYHTQRATVAKLGHQGIQSDKTDHIDKPTSCHYIHTAHQTKLAPPFLQQKWRWLRKDIYANGAIIEENATSTHFQINAINIGFTF